MKKKFKKNFYATAIGSVPYTDETAACEKILAGYRDIPFWPQMPKRTFFENMYAQFMERFPCAVIDEAKKKVWIDTSGDLLGGIEKAYQKILDEDCEYFDVSKKHAAGFYEFLSQAESADLKDAAFLKGHVTGPISFGLSVTDENKQPILYNGELSEVMVKILAMKARGQIRRLKKVFNDIIIFIDEPYLVSIGSSVVNIKKADAVTKIGEVIGAIHGEGALAGIHCCGNTDWSMLLGLGLDILNFDAYNFLKSLALYPEELKDFLKKDGVLAWGIVPTSEAVRTEDAGSLAARIEDGLKHLAAKGVDEKLVLDSLVVTPSCGCGTMEAEDADRALSLNVEVSRRMRKDHGR